MELTGSGSNSDLNYTLGVSHDASKNNFTGKEAFVNHGMSFSDIY